jgi:hypothetical protein
VEDDIASSDSTLKRRRIPQIADYSFGTERFDVPSVAAGAYEEPEVRTIFKEDTSHMAADESRGAGHKSFHRNCQLSAISSRFFRKADS